MARLHPDVPLNRAGIPVPLLHIWLDGDLQEEKESALQQFPWKWYLVLDQEKNLYTNITYEMQAGF